MGSGTKPFRPNDLVSRTINTKVKLFPYERCEPYGYKTEEKKPFRKLPIHINNTQRQPLKTTSLYSS